MRRRALARRRKPFEPVRGPSEKVLDDLMRRVVFLRDNFTCLMCERRCTLVEARPDGTYRYTGIQLAHVRTRRYKSTRWMPENAMTLCEGCHLKWHAPPPGFNPLAWFDRIAPGRLERIDLRLAVRDGKPIDRALIKVALLNELNGRHT